MENRLTLADEYSRVACRCRIKNWRQLRAALGMTQGQFAEMLRVARRSVERWESSGSQHACILPSTELLLATWLDDPDLAERLRAANLPNPFGRPTEATLARA